MEMISPQKVFLYCFLHVLSSTVGIFAFGDVLPGFLLTGPKHATRGTEENYCLHLQGIQGASVVSLELICETCEPSQNISSAQERLTADSNDGSCILLSLHIPLKYEYKPYTLRLRVYREDPEGAENPQVIIDSVKGIRLHTHKRLELIETDKTSYKTGQPLRFQTLSLDHHLRPLPSVVKNLFVGTLSLSLLQRRIVSSEFGLTDHEFDNIRGLKNEMLQIKGIRRITVRDKVSEAMHIFDVNDNVPDLRFIVIAPEQVLRSTDVFNVTICANQNWTDIREQSLWSVRVTVMNHPFSSGMSDSLNLDWDKEAHCAQTTEVNLTSLLPGLEQSDHDFDLKLTGEVFHRRNGDWDTVYKDSVTVRLVSEENKPPPSHLSLETPPTYKLGLPYIGKVIVRDRSNGKLTPNENVRVCVTEGFTNPNVTSPEWVIYPQEKKCETLVTSDNGEAQFSVVPKDSEAVILNIEAFTFEYKKNWTLMVRALAKPSYSPSSTFGTIGPLPNQPLACNIVLKVVIYLTNVVEGQAFRLNYVITGRGDLLAHGTAEDHVRGAEFYLPGVLDKTNLPYNVSAFEFELHVAPEFSPNATLTVFFPREGELVTAQTELRIAPCYPNPVTFQWDTNTSFPGNKANITINAAPGSLCRVAVVDETVALYNPSWENRQEPVLKQLTKFAINSRALPRQKTPDLLHCAQSSSTETPEEVEVSEQDSKGQWVYRSFYEDVIQTFDMAGLLVMSNWTLESRPCHGAFVSSDKLQSVKDDDFLGGQKEYIKDVTWTEQSDRSMDKLSYIPETSLWELHTTDSTGVAHLESTLATRGGPWIGRALCVSNTSGFGISADVKISVPDLFSFDFAPTSVAAIHGEPFTVNLTVKNLLNSTLPVQLRIERGRGFEILSQLVYESLCIEANESAVVQFTIRPIVLRPFSVRAKAEVVENCDVQSLPSYNVKAEAVFDVVRKTLDEVLKASLP